MSWFKKMEVVDDQEEQSEISRLSEQIETLRGEVRALRTEKDRTREVNELAEQITALKIEKSKLVEDNAREVREVEHKVGLLQKKQEQEVANAIKEAELNVREANLDADKTRFQEEMKFQREHFDKVAADNKEMTQEILKRLPDLNATLTLKQATPAPARRTAAKKA
jgi:hypothetical protein